MLKRVCVCGGGGGLYHQHFQRLTVLRAMMLGVSNFHVNSFFHVENKWQSQAVTFPLILRNWGGFQFPSWLAGKSLNHLESLSVYNQLWPFFGPKLRTVGEIFRIFPKMHVFSILRLDFFVFLSKLPYNVNIIFSRFFI